VLLSLLPSIVFGLLLVGCGVAMFASHRKSWRIQQADDTLNEADREYFCRRFRRRSQVAALIALIGVLIPLGDLIFTVVVPNRRVAGLFPLYFGSVLLLGLWVGVLGLADWTATMSHARAALARTEAERRALEEKLKNLKTGLENRQHEWN
jgi:cell division protein FtsB